MPIVLKSNSNMTKSKAKFMTLLETFIFLLAYCNALGVHNTYNYSAGNASLEVHNAYNYSAGEEKMVNKCLLALSNITDSASFSTANSATTSVTLLSRARNPSYNNYLNFRSQVLHLGIPISGTMIFVTDPQQWWAPKYFNIVS